MAKKPMSATQKVAETRKAGAGKATKAKAKTTAKGERVAGPSNEQQNISIRKIDNGYVVSQSQYKAGQYVERQTYTPTKPQINIANAPKGGSK